MFTFQAMTSCTRSLILLGSLATLLFGLTNCKNGGGNAGNTIVVGEFASLTGSEATFGTSSHEGTMMAFEDLNAAGGLFGKKFELITEDNLSKAGDSATIANKLISKDNAVALLGEVASGRSNEAAPICQQNKIPMISPASTNPNVTQKGDYIFRVCFTDVFQGKVLSNFAHNSLKAKKVAIFTDAKSDYSKGLTKYFKENFTKVGEINLELNYNGKDKDFRGQLTSLKASNPDAIFVPGYYADVAVICIQAKELGISTPIFGGDGWESEDLLKLGQDAMEGKYFSTHYSPEVSSAKSVAFVEAYKKRFNGKVPDAMAALGYDSAFVLADAMKRAGSTDGEKVKIALAATKDFQGVTGNITMNADRDVEKAMVILQVQNGKFKYLETVNP
jgi:branched-chain amino acid transport system substrate-binding protein